MGPGRLASQRVNAILLFRRYDDSVKETQLVPQNDPLEITGTRITAWRKRFRYSKARLARQLGRTPQTIAKWEESRGIAPHARAIALQLLGLERVMDVALADTKAWWGL